MNTTIQQLAKMLKVFVKMFHRSPQATLEIMYGPLVVVQCET